MPWEYIGGGGGQIDVSGDKCGLEQPYLSKALICLRFSDQEVPK